MKEKIPLIVSFVFILAGLVKFDMFIYPTLDYFGKYVAVLILNIFPFLVSWELFKKYNYKISLIWGIVAGIILYFL